MMKLRFTIILLLISINHCIIAQTPIYDAATIHHPIVAQNGMVATQHNEATKVGVEILRKGGNAVDAAVAVGFSLAVVLPRAGNIGGGGFMLLHSEKENKTTSINYREMAPGASDKDMFLDENGDVDNRAFNLSYNSAGVPGTVAGLAYALEKYGTMSLEEVLQPAIRLAEDGFEMTYDFSRLLQSYENRLKACPETEKVFYKENNEYYQPGEIFKQPDLAWSLKQIAKNGAKAFYEGEIAKRVVEDMKENGGIMRMEDFANYQVEEAEPVWGKYRGYEIASMPPPSSGGVHVVQMLNILEQYPLKYLGHNSAETLHFMAEAMKLAYADRSEHLGDPAFWDVPVEGLASKEYADDLREKVNRYSTTPSENIKPGNPVDYESNETTHFTVVDKAGNVVSNTYTLNFSYGNGIVAKGTGILLNNEMGDFSAKPGTPNAFGLIGGEANSIQPGKRPLSSMTPTLVFKNKKPYLATGSPGGSRIITTVLQIILNVIDHDMNIAEASHAVRIHHQWLPDVLYAEKGLSHDTKQLLAQKGHIILQRSVMGSTQSIMLKDGYILGASDPRRPDGGTLGF
ncbi:MAG: gamma-glutamyltransferase [Saprospiraceae bacterium]|nr:gamma-glutamyltransferase [Saprospiraceae bacterium]